MIVIVCLDDRNGMMFNNRRQSMDSKLREYVINYCGKADLWMTPYSFKQFENCGFQNIRVDENCLGKAEKDDFCFVENSAISPYIKKIDKFMIFRWNRTYPYDTTFDIPVEELGFECSFKDEFAGSSHDKINLEVYER